jgi:hypothetical protein
MLLAANKVIRCFLFGKSARKAHEQGREVLMEGATNRSEYDLNSAITFLIVGLGIGSLLSVLFDPRPRPTQREAPEEINSWRMSELRPEREARAEERVA